jgi:uncharacterized protein YkwD
VQKQGKWILAAVGAWALMLAGSIGLLGMAFNWWGGDPRASAADLSGLRAQPSETATAEESVEATTPSATPTLTPTLTPTPTPTSTPKPKKTKRADPAPQPKETTRQPEPEPDREPEPKRTTKPKPPGPTSREIAYEDEVVRYTNMARRESGCGPVRVDSKIRDAARKHAYDMAANHYFDHSSRDGRSPWDRMRAAGYNQPAAENIAKGQSDAQRVMAAWLMSEGHRNNIINCRIKAIGVGVRLGGDGPYWVQDFGYR